MHISIALYKCIGESSPVYLYCSKILIGSTSFFLQVIHVNTTLKSRTSSKFGQIRSWITDLPALERLENPHRLIMGEMLWSLATLFLIGYSSYLQVTSACIMVE